MAKRLPTRVMVFITLISVTVVAAGLYRWGVRDEGVYLVLLCQES